MQETLTLSVDQLSDLWLIKYGSTWVNFEEQEEFYQYAQSIEDGFTTTKKLLQAQTDLPHALVIKPSETIDNPFK
jgi:hypothetical protein